MLASCSAGSGSWLALALEPSSLAMHLVVVALWLVLGLFGWLCSDWLSVEVYRESGAVAVVGWHAGCMHTVLVSECAEARYLSSGTYGLTFQTLSTLPRPIPVIHQIPHRGVLMGLWSREWLWCVHKYRAHIPLGSHSTGAIYCHGDYYGMSYADQYRAGTPLHANGWSRCVPSS